MTRNKKFLRGRPIKEDEEGEKIYICEKAKGTYVRARRRGGVIFLIPFLLKVNALFQQSKQQRRFLCNQPCVPTDLTLFRETI